MLWALYHDTKRTTSMLLLCDHSVYLTHALRISFLLDASRNFSNDFPQVQHDPFISVVRYPLSKPSAGSFYGPFSEKFSSKFKKFIFSYIYTIFITDQLHYCQNSHFSGIYIIVSFCLLFSWQFYGLFFIKGVLCVGWLHENLKPYSRKIDICSAHRTYAPPPRK
jgi:hypothetical protein